MPSRHFPPVWLAPAVLGAVLSVAGLAIFHKLDAPPSAEDAPVGASSSPSEPAVSPTPSAVAPPAASESAVAPQPHPSVEVVKPPVVAEEAPTPQPSVEAAKPSNASENAPTPQAREAAPSVVAPTPQPGERAHVDAKPALEDLAKPAPPAEGQAQEDVGRAAVEGDGAVSRRKPAPVPVSRAPLGERARRQTQLCPTADNRPLAPLPRFAPPPRRAARFSARRR